MDKAGCCSKFWDLLSLNVNQTESTIETVKDNILLQVYDPTFDAFIDMTDYEELPDNAKLKLEVINISFGAIGGNAVLKEYIKPSSNMLQDSITAGIDDSKKSLRLIWANIISVQ